ncbi:MAG TPA: efflux RND transporter permease subunit, partial [Gemmataceae bacterium]|nr:efflux RND transporter permease subunit [Gemmataceae bacterium]
EFAKHEHEEGRLSRFDATLEACRLRLRPILMTSFAFILGVVPLLLGRGAGYEMRQRLGIAVFSGMLGVTLFGIFLTPVFFFVIEWLVESRLFHGKRVHVFGRVALYVLNILTLGLFWLVPLALRRWPRRRVLVPGRVQREPVTVSGNGDRRENGEPTPFSRDARAERDGVAARSAAASRLNEASEVKRES